MSSTGIFNCLILGLLYRSVRRQVRGKVTNSLAGMQPISTRQADGNVICRTRRIVNQQSSNTGRVKLRKGRSEAMFPLARRYSFLR